MREHLSRCFGNILNEDIERAHRIGKLHDWKRKPRQIIVKFARYKIKEKIWSQRAKLKGSNLWLSEDFPPRIREERKKLMPAFLSARKNKAVKIVKLTLDRLTIDNKEYTVDTLHELPDAFGFRAFSVQESDTSVVFASKNAIFSNLHECSFEHEGQNFKSTEQLIQISKAKLFNDEESVKKIMNESDPYQQMQLGKSVRNFNKDKWNARAREVILTANMAKYAQNESAREALVKTGKKKLGEATLHPVFGIGLKLTSKNVNNTTAWTGKNLMGEILEEIREKLLPYK